MSVPFKPQGTWTALVTPFDRNDAVDHAVLKRFVEFQLAQGVDGIVPAGTTGESPALDWEEHNRVIADCIGFAHARAGVLAGTGSNSTQEAILATRQAAKAGASAALVVDCYYNGPSSLELRTEYYEQIARHCPEIPLVPYIIPGRTGTALSAEDMALLHLHAPQRFPAVKQATGDLQRMRQDRALAGDGLAILSGDDDLTLAMMQDPAIRAAGVISVMSNLVPGAVSRMVKHARAGETKEALCVAAQLDPLFKLVACKLPGSRLMPDGKEIAVEDKFRNPVPVKTMLLGLGVPVGSCRRPLGKMTKAAVERCRAALRAVHASNPELFAPLGQAFGSHIRKQLEDDRTWAELAR